MAVVVGSSRGFVWMLVALGFPLCRPLNAATPVPEHTDPAFIKQYVYQHNKFRSLVSPSASNMLYMTWDPALAKLANAWTKNCKFENNPYVAHPYKPHPTFPAVGENIWLGSSYGIQSPVVAWHEEAQYYSYSGSNCSDMCGHYTQVVWADSYKVGCAARQCSNIEGYPDSKNWAIVVCNYGPAGNTIRKSPYRQGTACSECPDDQCVENMCRNDDRDKVKNYPNWQPAIGYGCFSARLYEPLYIIVCLEAIVDIKFWN
ncbi:GLIPR1-like protein 1 [Rhinatrema bivittatum]|uniref:GLIPR1-like protein 1 n=1 Tax=Rhinatrema bivittatum TaxID=194408 RepID=UPI00112C2B33|nr:GLIPR1-like protein 1 [Rhinatrema bivittatum]